MSDLFAFYELSKLSIQNYQRDALNIIYVQLCPPEDEYLILETCRGE